MTDISESGIEAAAKVIFVEGWGTPEFRRNLVVAVLQAYLPFHPPAREEGLREALAEIERLRLATTEGSLRVRADRMWEIARSALIPMKPEAKESGE